MREICTSGSVGGEGGNILAYLAVPRATGEAFPEERRAATRLEEPVPAKRGMDCRR
jgi:hypothetical protein